MNQKYHDSQNPVVTIHLDNERKIEVELYPKLAPNTVNSFISLINKGYYDGLTFHRVIRNFVIQGGCPEGTGTGGPGYNIKGEFTANGHPNDLHHSKGVISMARAQHPNSAGSQFFIMHGDSPHLDGQYAGFGEVISGLEYVDQIVEAPTDFRDNPVEPQMMLKVEVDTKGIDYPEVIKA